MAIRRAEPVRRPPRVRDKLGTEPATRPDMNDLLLPLAIVVVWFVLNTWVLPKFGVST